MKSKILGMALACGLLLTSCEKEKPDICAAGSIEFVNNTANKYQLTINGTNYGAVNGYNRIKWDFSKGAYNIEALQLEGYIVSPSKYIGAVNVDCGQAFTYSWP